LRVEKAAVRLHAVLVGQAKRVRAVRDKKQGNAARGVRDQRIRRRNDQSDILKRRGRRRRAASVDGQNAIRQRLTIYVMLLGVCGSWESARDSSARL
jgi:hypothetical protein